MEKIKLVLKEFLEIQLKHLTLPIDEDELKKILERLIEQLEGSELSGNIREGDLAVGEPQRVVRHLKHVLRPIAQKPMRPFKNILKHEYFESIPLYDFMYNELCKINNTSIYLISEIDEPELKYTAITTYIKFEDYLDDLNILNDEIQYTLKKDLLYMKNHKDTRKNKHLKQIRQSNGQFGGKFKRYNGVNKK